MNAATDTSTPPDSRTMQYTTLLFDLDHTLFDFDASNKAAFSKTLATAGIKDASAFSNTFARINAALWADVERGLLSPNDVRSLRFENLINEEGIDADPAFLADHYVIGLGAEGGLLPGAREVLSDLSQNSKLALVSNGIGQVQRDRIARLGLDAYFRSIVISGEVGVSKPSTEIFDIVFDQLGQPDPRTVLMIGDSLTSDIQGGINYGIDTVWYAPGVPPTVPSDATHHIQHLNEIRPIILGP